MALKTEWIRYGKDGQYLGYLAYFDHVKQALPGVVVIQEIWGVDSHIRDVTERFAKAGYVAFAPDLFARDGRRPEHLSEESVEAAKVFMDTLPPGSWGNPKDQEAGLAKLSEPKRSQVSATVGKLFGAMGADREYHTDAVIAAAAHLRDECPASKGQKVGCLGFCMGGSLSALLACRDPQLACAVIFYGQAPPKDQIPNIKCKVMGIYGETDKRLVDALPEFTENMKQAGKSFEPHVYAATGHGFFNNTRLNYNVTSARDAFARTLTFLNQNLGAPKQ